MSNRRTHSTIEHNLRLLSMVALGVFAALIAALVVVQHSLVASHRMIEAVVVPAQQDLGRLDSAVAAVFEHEARVLSTTSSRQLEAIGDSADAWLELEGAHAQLESHLGAGGDVEARAALARAAQMDPAILGFLRADDELVASMARFHALREDFARRLVEAQAGLRGLTEQSAAIQGVVALKYTVLLRRVARNPGESLIREVVFGDARAQLQCVEDLANAALDLSALSGRIGLAADSDALNSIAANEMAQTRQRIADRLEDLAELTSRDADLAERAGALRKRFAELAARIGDDQRDDSLIAIRRAIVVEQRHAAEVRETGAQRARQLTADVAVLQDAANALTAESSKRARRVANATRLGVLLLAAAGIAATVLGARRVRASVRDLHAQNSRLAQLRDELTNVNARLEDQVAQRTMALAHRERSLQLVLDSTGDGLLTVALDGTVMSERSRAASAWFGAPAERAVPVWELFFPDDPKAALGLRMSFEQLVEEALPFEVTAEQMPRRLARGDRTLELAWKPVTEGGAMKRVLVVARDISERVEAEEAEQQAQELRDLVGSVLRDKAGFADGVGDARALLEVLGSTDDGRVLARALHTLKGNAGMFGFHRLAADCHALESALVEGDRLPTPEQIASLRHRLDETLSRIRDVFGEDFLSLIEVHERDWERLMQALELRYEHASVLAFVASWRDESVGAILRRFANQARRIATSLGKELDVVIDDGGARVPAGALRVFWNALVHAVRNAVDHGIEPPEERVATGKPSPGRLALRARADGAELVVQVDDDGRGIDFEALREAAMRRGLPHSTREDLVDAMFADGVTTRSEVTELSGRGVGLAALKQACRELGGTLDVDSRAGAGTRLTFRLPLGRTSSVTWASSAAE